MVHCAELLHLSDHALTTSPPEVPMTIKFAASICWLFFCAAMFTAAITRQAACGENAAPLPRITIDARVVELPIDKVRAIRDKSGDHHSETINVIVDELLKAQGERSMSVVQDLLPAIDSWQQRKIARLLAAPRLLTLSGRPAVLRAGPTTLYVTPTLLEDGQIKVKCALELSEPHADGDRNQKFETTVALKPGHDLLIGNLPPIDAGQTPQSLTVFCLRATVGKPEISDVKDHKTPMDDARSSVVKSVEWKPVAAVAVEPAIAPPPSVAVELWVAELSVPALHGFHIDTPHDQPKENSDASLLEMFQTPKKMHPKFADNLVQTLDFLKARKAADFLAQPKLMTRSGQPASLAVGSLKFEATPTIKDDGTIRVSYKVEISKKDPKLTDTITGAPGWRTFSNACAIDDLEPSKAVLVVPAVPWNAFGEPSPGKAPDKMLVVVLRASPAEGTPDAAAVTTQKGTYVEAAPNRAR
jgi:hypothetical protein